MRSAVLTSGLDEVAAGRLRRNSWYRTRVGWGVDLRRVFVLSASAFVVLIASCGGDAEPVASSQVSPLPVTPSLLDAPQPSAAPATSAGPSMATTVPGPATLRDGIADVDCSMAIVELSDVYFDTFDGRFVPLPETTLDMRRALLDAIRPLDAPPYEAIAGGDWLDPDDLVIGYVGGGQAYAFPHKILNYHEIVNDEFDGIPVLISYCPLCRSGVVYDRRLDGVALSFSNSSALYESDLVMVDRETGSYWWQVPGRAIVGTLSGSELTPLGSSTMTRGDWRSLHPETLILSADTGSPIDYGRDPFVGYEERVDAGGFVFPVSAASRDDRLSAGTLIFGIESADTQRVYPLGSAAAINDLLSEVPLVVLTWDGGGAAFSRISGGGELNFSLEDGAIVDDETGSTWSRDGLAIAGEMSGARLEALPARMTFWFAYVGAFPAAEVFTR